MIYLQLFLISLIPIVQSVIFYFAKTKSKFFQNFSYKKQQIIIGCFFGVSAILGTVFGVNIGGATANARDAAPICAGLIFGAPAGIIAGVIGGVYRFIATYWGAGFYSQVACSISTIIAGCFAASLRKYVFDNKCPSWVFGLVTAIVMEVAHLTILFILRINDVEKASQIVQICTIPMVVCNGFSVAVSIVLVKLCAKEPLLGKWKYQQITSQVQSLLLAVVLFAYLVTSIFVYAYLSNFAFINSKKSISTSLTDIENELIDIDVDDIPSYATHKHVGNQGFIIIANNDKKIISISEDYAQYLDKLLSDIGIEKMDKFSELQSTKINNVDCLSMFDKIDVGENSYYIVASMTQLEAFSTRLNSLYVNTFMEILVFALLFIMIYELIKRLVVNNLRKINGSLSKIIDGDLNTNVNVETSQEFSSLSNDINTTVATLKHYIDEAAQRLDQELLFAKNIQHSAIPSVFPAYPNIKEFNIYASMDTAKQVGGDFYDFYMLGSYKLAFLVADVSGKGIPAAMFMMRAKTVIKSLTETGLPINEVFERANNKLCEGNDAGMFVTAFMGVLDITTGQVDFVNAGHETPFVYRKNHGFEQNKINHGFILAGMENTKYKLQTLQLNKGDKIFQYTDGVTEATNAETKLFGMERLEQTLNKYCDKSNEEVLKGVKDDIDAFVGDAPQFDDITMLCLEYNG